MALSEMGGVGMESFPKPSPPPQKLAGGGARGQQRGGKEQCGGYFQMPLHYPRYTRAEYETMPEWKVECLLRQYGLPVAGDVERKRKFAMGAFLWIH